MSATPASKSVLLTVLAMVALSLGIVSSAAADDVEDFHYWKWDVDYDVSRNDQGRAVAVVHETLHAQFPNRDQNRGIIRSLPLRYHSAPAAPEDIRIHDAAGNEVPFEVEDEDGFRHILIGDDTFVQGAQTYQISYTLEDVMHATEAADEFYWDLIPSDRHQPIDEVAAHVSFDTELTAALTGNTACYVGTPQDSQNCGLQQTGESEATFRLEPTGLPAGHGVTVAVGVTAGTITQPAERQENFLLDVGPLILTAGALSIALGGALAVWSMRRAHRNNIGAVETLYGVPPQMTPLVARWILGRGHDPINATLLELAVSGVLRIEEIQDTSGRRGKPTTKPVLRLVDPHLTDEPLHTGLLQAMFPDLTPGATFDFPKDHKPFNQAVQRSMTDSGQAVLERGYQHKKRHRAAAVAGWIALALLIPAAVLLVLGASRDNAASQVTSVVLGLLTLGLVIACVSKHRVLTPRGAAVRQHLLRIQQVLRAGEAQRLEMLQSFGTAPRLAARSPQPAGRTLALYDRLLPYAVLFNTAQDWTTVMTTVYTQHNWPAPAWYPALFSSAHSSADAALSSMVSSMSSAAATASPSAGATGGGGVGSGGGGGAAGGR